MRRRFPLGLSWCLSLKACCLIFFLTASGLVHIESNQGMVINRREIEEEHRNDIEDNRNTQYESGVCNRGGDSKKTKRSNAQAKNHHDEHHMLKGTWKALA